MNGGYIMVDCGGLDLTANAKKTYAGLYAKCKAALESDRAILACNCTYDSKHVTPIAVFAVDYTSEIVFTSSILQIHVDTDDGVTIVNFTA